MIGALTSFIGGLFSSSKTTDTLIDYIRKSADLDDMTPKERIDALISYHQATRHMSPTRRLIAIGVLGIWMWLIVSWAVLVGVGNMFDVSGAISTAGLLFTMIKEVSVYFGVIVSFYFVNNLINSVKAK